MVTLEPEVPNIPVLVILNWSVVPTETNSLDTCESVKNCSLNPTSEESEVSNFKLLLFYGVNGRFIRLNSWDDSPVFADTTVIIGFDFKSFKVSQRLILLSSIL